MNEIEDVGRRTIHMDRITPLNIPADQLLDSRKMRRKITLEI